MERVSSNWWILRCEKLKFVVIIVIVFAVVATIIEIFGTRHVTLHMQSGGEITMTTCLYAGRDLGCHFPPPSREASSQLIMSG